MRLIPIILGAATVVIASFVIKTRLADAVMNADLDTTRPAAAELPMQQLQNDKLIIVKGVDYTDLKKVIFGFCNMYNKEACQALPRMIRLSVREFAIVFPRDIDFEIYCYFSLNALFSSSRRNI